MVVHSDKNWQGRKVLITGHTGFKGAWLSMWLASYDAIVHGYALDPPTTPSLFTECGVGSMLASDTRADVGDLAAMREIVSRSAPEVVFHLAAQPLVRDSYSDPIGTFTTNIIGTANVLEAARQSPSVRAIVVVTTDKVYANHERGTPFAETDALGGYDPYSASKAGAEIVTSSFRQSFFNGGAASHAARVATARAGNVIGGGDWAVDRLIPDCLRAFERGAPVCLRYPNAVRPWQHVFEPLAGYIRLAERLLGDDGPGAACAWNFGPNPDDERTVKAVADEAARRWGGNAAVEIINGVDAPHEAGLLRLNSAQACAQLGWKSRWSVLDAIEHTVAWHHAWRAGRDINRFSLEQIQAYETAAQ